MSLDLDRSDKYEYEVKGHTLGDNGCLKPFDFTVFFKRLTTEELQDIFNPPAAEPRSAIDIAMGEEPPRKKNDLDICREVVVGWEGVRSGGQPVPFDKAVFEKLLENHYVVTAIVVAFMKSVHDGLGKTSPRRRNG